MDQYTKILIDRHAQSSRDMCKFYCTQFIHTNYTWFSRIVLLKTIMHLKHLSLDHTYQII